MAFSSQVFPHMGAFIFGILTLATPSLINIYWALVTKTLWQKLVAQILGCRSTDETSWVGAELLDSFPNSRLALSGEVAFLGIPHVSWGLEVPTGLFIQSLVCSYLFVCLFIFIFGCAGSSLLHRLFSLVVANGDCPPVVGPRLLIVVASLVGEHRL